MSFFTLFTRIFSCIRAVLSFDYLRLRCCSWKVKKWFLQQNFYLEISFSFLTPIFSPGAFSRSSRTGIKLKLSQEPISISHSWMTKQWNHLPLPFSVGSTSNLLRAIRGSRNPNLQVAITHSRDVCKFATIKTRRKLGWVRFCKDFWDRFCGRACQLLANFFALFPVTSHKTLHKTTRHSFCLVSKKPGLGCSNVRQRYPRYK